MFGAFILACGTTHLLGIITLWHPIYWLDAGMKAFTAIISVVTAIVLVKLVPEALKLPTTSQYDHEIEERLRAYENMKSAQMTQQESEERLSLATRSTGVGIWDWNIQTNTLVWDDSMFELYHMKREDFTNALDAWEKSLHPDDKLRARKVSEDAMNNIKPYDTEFRIIRPNGEVRHIKAVAKVFFDANHKPLRMLGTNIDITKNILLDKMKSEFISTATHELRTPMTTIFGYAELLKDIPLDAEEQKEMIATIHAQSKAMIALLNDVLDMAKMEAAASNFIQMKLQPIGPILEALTNTFITDTNHNKVVLEMSPNLPHVNVDKTKIEQAIRNLLSNAYKFSPNNDEISMHVSEVMHEGRAKVLISIQDHGIGMTPAQLERVYEKFYRADQSGQVPGTGLGMSITKDIITHHGGTIEIESKPGAGTRVMVYLPAAA
ncbi:BaeS Signal transduction histidine kinase [Methylophilaceae bacterium]